MPTDTDLAALMLTPAQLGDLLRTLASGSHGVTVCGRVEGATQEATGVALRLRDVLLHLGPAPLSLPAAKPKAPEPKPEG